MKCPSDQWTSDAILWPPLDTTLVDYTPFVGEVTPPAPKLHHGAQNWITCWINPGADWTTH